MKLFNKTLTEKGKKVPDIIKNFYKFQIDGNCSAISKTTISLIDRRNTMHIFKQFLGDNQFSRMDRFNEMLHNFTFNDSNSKKMTEFVMKKIF